MLKHIGYVLFVDFMITMYLFVEFMITMYLFVELKITMYLFKPTVSRTGSAADQNCCF